MAYLVRVMTTCFDVIASDTGYIIRPESRFNVGKGNANVLALVPVPLSRVEAASRDQTVD